MGTSCSKLDKDPDPDYRHEKELQGSHPKLHQKLVSRYRGVRMENPEAKEPLVIGHYERQLSTKLDTLDPSNPLIYEKQTPDPTLSQESAPTPQQLEPEYFSDRAEIARRGQQLAFDHALTQKATPAERKAKQLLEIARRNDDIAFYSTADPLRGYRGQKHSRFAGDHFLTNLDLLDQTVLFKVAQQMPKGAHLHIHFNSTLLPDALLDIAQGMEQMYISSDKPLTDAENLDACEIQFLMKSEEVVARDRAKLQAVASRDTSVATESESCNLLSEKYTQVLDETNQRLSWMKYREFRDHWDQISKSRASDRKRTTRGSITRKLLGSENKPSAPAFEGTWKDWLISKLVFDDQEAHNSQQTSEG